jgi:hypothetical protein
MRERDHSMVTRWIVVVRASGSGHPWLKTTAWPVPRRGPSPRSKVQRIATPGPMAGRRGAPGLTESSVSHRGPGTAGVVGYKSSHPVSRRSLDRCVIRDPDDRALMRLARGPSCPSADTGPCGHRAVRTPGRAAPDPGAEHCLLAKPVSDDSTGQAELAVHPFEMAPEGGLCLGDASGALTSSPFGAYAQDACLGTAAGVSSGGATGLARDWEPYERRLRRPW